MDVKQISELIDILSRSDVSTLKYEEDSFKLTLMKEKPAPRAVVPVAAAPVQHAVPAEAVQDVSVPLPAAQEPAPAVPAEEGLLEITTPFVGTYYSSPSPDAAPFVKVGSRIAKGQVLCIVEAMKLMNEIEAEHDGEIVEILATNGQPVEFGEILFRVRPA